MKRVWLQVGAPILSVATLMLGLRVGAGESVRSATIYGAPIGKPSPDGKTRVAWQMTTFLDERMVKETLALESLTVTARTKSEEITWKGATNMDGIAEINLAFSSLAPTDPIDLDVRMAGDPAPLARGRVTLEMPSWGGLHEGAMRPTSRTGAIGLDVVVEEGRLVPGFPSSVWVRASPPIVDLPITITPEPGVQLDRDTITTCDGGWAEAKLNAQAHVVGAAFEAKAPDGTTGKWFGAIQVAPGAFFASMPRTIEPGKPSVAVILAPNPRKVVYVELDDERGRIAAAALPLLTEPGDPTPRARFELPPLAEGLHWLVVSGEPRGATELTGVTIAKPFLVGPMQNACNIGPWLARRQANGFPRWTALDGAPSRGDYNKKRRTLGLFISMISLAAAALLEVLLLIAGTRETRAAFEAAEGEEDAKPVVTRTPGGSLAIAALLAVLGFALLAVLLFVKA